MRSHEDCAVKYHVDVEVDDSGSESAMNPSIKPVTTHPWIQKGLLVADFSCRWRRVIFMIIHCLS